MVLSTAPKPAGGFQFIAVPQLCALWFAYREAGLPLADVRVWFAAQELRARRCQLTRTQQPTYTYDELAQVVSKGGGMAASLRRLREHDLLVWDSHALTFPRYVGGTLPSAVDIMLSQITNPSRQIPVPRRLLRFFAKGCSRVLVATILGHLFRCLYYRQGQCRAEGFCKASWIAQVFGVSERAVKTARHRLEAVGFLQRTETPHWVRNRYGEKMTINLQWEGAPSATTRQPAPASEIAPPRATLPAQIAPPDSHTKLLSEHKHQEPASDGSPGVLSTLFLQARECLRTGSSLLSESEPAPTPSAAPPAPPPLASVPRTPPLSAPRLHQVFLADLQDSLRLLQLYKQAVQRHLIGPSEAERLSFVALAQHVLAYRPANPGGLFVQLLRQRRFAVITQAEEDRAQQRLKRYWYEPDWARLRQATG